VGLLVEDDGRRDLLADTPLGPLLLATSHSISVVSSCVMRNRRRAKAGRGGAARREREGEGHQGEGTGGHEHAEILVRKS
jgi:hypothetical protein